jgi:DNA mismatch repair ATPase MutS
LQLAEAGQLSNEGLAQLQPQSLTLTQQGNISSCHLSVNTLLSLGVIADSSVVGQPQWSLYSSIEPFLKTKQGRRLLRASLLQPLTSVPTIEERYNAIAELVDNAGLQSDIQEFLASTPKDARTCLPALPKVSATDTAGKQSAATSTAFIQAVLRLRSLMQATQV